VANNAAVVKYVRVRRGGAVSYGVLEGDTVRLIDGGLFGERKLSGESAALQDVELLRPCEPSKILCVGLNYASHLQGREAPTHPEIFYKPLTALQDPEGPIEIPLDSKDLHFEAEAVIVIGRTARHVSKETAEDYILGYTCGNDVSERNWQKGSMGDAADRQWWRAKGADTFAPLGPCIAAGLDYRNSRIQCRLNGDVVQSQMLSDLIFDAPTMVSFASRYVTLLPGDVIYTGTPGKTKAMKPGDVVEVEIEGIGTLRNRVIANRG
jgi:2-keto-4-pentenoate hydratase/2-oxohepta-3-ene-1,7-dioic acid hydratase in catechol pathway